MLYLASFWSLNGTTTFISDPTGSLIVKYILAVTCGSLSLSHGSVTYNQSSVANGKYPVHTKASFSCKYGYKHSGDETRRCQTSGSWTLKNTPRCTQGKLLNGPFTQCYTNVIVLGNN